MRKIVLTIGLLLVMLLAACGAPLEEPGTVSGSSAAPQDQSLDQSSDPLEPPEFSTQSDAKSASFADIKDVIVEDGQGGTFVFTIAQQETLVAQLNDVIAKYESGEYPLPMGENTDYAPFAQVWPNDLPYPEIITANQLFFTNEGFEMFGVGIRVDISPAYTMTVSLYNNQDLTETDADYWGVGDVEVIKT